MIERQKKIYLCRPNGKILTQLNGVQTNSVKYDVHAKDYNSLSFNVDRLIIVDGKPIESNGYEWLCVGMNILVEGCDMFQMQEPTVVNDGIKEYKTVKANSIDYEFQEKNWVGLKVNTGSDDSLEYLIPNNTNSFGVVEQGNYITIYQGNQSGRTDHSLLHYIIEKVPGWSINDADIDGVLWDRKITIEEDNINLYALLTSVIGPKAECIFLFDTINKKIKAISKESLNESYFDTNIFISMRNLIQNIQVNTNEDSVYTVFNVAGDNNLDVGSVNYNDKYVYDLSYFMSEPWMSTATAEKIQAWADWRDEHRDEFIELSKELEEKSVKIKEIIYQVPNDGDDWQQWDQMDRENLTKAREMYVSYLNALRENADPDPSYDPVTHIYVPREDAEEDYESWLYEDNKGYYTYIEIRDYIIPNIDIAYANKGVTEDEKVDYVKTYETNWDLFGISILEGKEEGYLQQLEQLDKYKKPWNQLTPEEKTQHLNEGDYNVKHNTYAEIHDTFLPGLRARLATLRSQVSDLEDEVADIKSDINDLVEKAKISSPDWELTQEELDLFTQLCKYTDYTNKNIITTTSDDTITMIDVQKTLYDDAVSKLSEVSQPQYTFSVSTDNFFDIPQFASWKEKFELLRFMRVGIRDDYSVKLRLVGYSTNPCEVDPLLSVDFSNFVTSRSGRSDLTELLDTENNSPSKNSISIGDAGSGNAEEYATKLFQMMSRSGLLSSGFGNSGTVTSTNSSFSGVSTANLIQMYTRTGYITDAVMSEAKITDYLDAVKVNAATIQAGTLVADRILLKNDASAILYQLNNFGALSSQETKTLDGYVLTDRTILADKIVADTITAREITTDKLRGTGGWINLRDGSFWYGHGAYTNQDGFVSYKEDPIEKAAEEALAAQINNGSNSISWINGVLNIDGTITAREGSIGGFSVTTSYDSSGVGETTANSGHMFENSLYAQSQNVNYEFEVGITSGAYAAGAGYALPTTKAFYIGQINKDAAWSTATDVFYVLHDGSMYATKGTIGGWTITSTTLHSSANNTATGGVLRYTGLQIPSSGDKAITVGATNFGDWSTAPFYVRHNGEMHATSAYITGDVTANTGYIGGTGGFTIQNGKLYSGSHSAWNSAVNGVYVGTDHIALGAYNSTNQACPFQVSNAGYLVCTSGKIGGWIINASYLGAGSIGQLDSVFLWPNGTTTNYTIGGVQTTGFVITAGQNFGVTKTGAMYSQSGIIAGWTIGTNSLSKSITSSGTTYSVTLNASSNPYIQVKKEISSVAQMDWVTLQGGTATIGGEKGSVVITQSNITLQPSGTNATGEKVIMTRSSLSINNGSTTSSINGGSISASSISATTFTENGTTLSSKYAAYGHNHSGTYVPISGNSSNPMTDDLWLKQGEYVYSTSTTRPQGVSLVGLSNNDNIFLGENNHLFDVYIYGSNVYHNNGTNHLISSDKRIKNSIIDIQKARDFILLLKPRMYKLNAGTSNRFHMGFIADEVEEILPKTIGDCGVFAKFPKDADTVIDLNDENTYIKGVRYAEIIAPTVAVVQQLCAENEQLRQRIDRLEKLLSERQ